MFESQQVEGRAGQNQVNVVVSHRHLQPGVAVLVWLLFVGRAGGGQRAPAQANGKTQRVCGCWRK
jgi:hypothetical protein